MDTLNQLILDFKTINSISQSTIQNEEIEQNSFVFIGKFIEKYYLDNKYYEILLSETNNTANLYLMKAETTIFLQNYNANNIFFKDLDRKKMFDEMQSYYEANYFFNMHMKRTSANKEFALQKDLIKENSSDTLSIDEKQSRTLFYRKTRENFEKINDEIVTMDYEIISNYKFFLFNYEHIYKLAQDLNKSIGLILTREEAYFDKTQIKKLYKLCNQVIFVNESESVYLELFNLKTTYSILEIKKSKKRHFHHLVHTLNKSINTTEDDDEWINKFLGLFKIDLLEHSKRHNYIKKIVDDTKKINKDSLTKAEKSALEFYQNLNDILNTQ